jgi:dCMP deaminase
MKPRLIKAYMQTAETFAELSHARRLHVGAIVVKDDRIISIGYNGMPAGWDNNCEDESVEPYAGFEGSIHRIVLKTKPEVLHAESNSISKLARSSESGDGSVMFVTHAPCIDCAKLIFQSGIRQVFYGEEYRSRDGIEFLEKCRVEVQQVKQ